MNTNDINISNKAKKAVSPYFNFNHFIESGKSFRSVNEEFILKVLIPRHSGIIDATCGVGKTTFQALTKAATFVSFGNKKYLSIGISTPRLLLNDQVINNVLELLNLSVNDVTIFWMCSYCNISKESIYSKSLGRKVTSIKDYKDACNKPACINKHHILITTQTSLRREANALLSSKNKKIFDLFMIDEGHKEVNKNMIDGIKNAAEQHLIFTATPTKELIEWDGQPIFSFGFTKALEKHYVVKPVLWEIQLDNLTYAETKDKNNVYKNEAKIAIDDNINHHHTHSSTLVFAEDIATSSYITNNLIPEYINKKYNGTVAIYQVLSPKKDKYGEEIGRCKYISYNKSTNEIEKKILSKYSLLKQLKNDEKTKHIIIINAKMIQEGIDLPDINGVVLLCRKSYENLYQAIMRGCRVTNGKTCYNLYVPNLLNDIDEAKRCEEFLNQIMLATDGNFEYGGYCNETGRNVTDTDNELLAKTDTRFKKLQNIYIKLKNEFDEKRSNFEKEVLKVLTNSEVSLSDILKEDINTRTKAYNIFVNEIISYVLTYEEKEIVKRMFNII